MESNDFYTIENSDIDQDFQIFKKFQRNISQVVDLFADGQRDEELLDTRIVFLNCVFEELISEGSCNFKSINDELKEREFQRVIDKSFVKVFNRVLRTVLRKYDHKLLYSKFDYGNVNRFNLFQVEYNPIIRSNQLFVNPIVANALLDIVEDNSNKHKFNPRRRSR